MLEGTQRVDSDIQQKGEEYLIAEIYKSMKETKYLVVLDDVWSSDLWTQLEVALLNTTNGSRVLITTGFLSVSFLAGLCKLINQYIFTSFLIHNIYVNMTIIIRFIKIAEEADAISKPYEIKALNEEESLQLLL